jgi:DNA-binding MarR family transcriptional regulator
MTSAREIAAASGPLGYAIAQVAHAHRLALVSRLGALDLHPGQELIVVDLHENPESTQAELVKRLGVDQSTVAKALARMERAGIVTRSRSDTDARVVRSRLTPRGKGLVENVLATWSELDRTVAGGLTPEEATHLVELLDKVRASITEGQ